jgi:hypothetical protein
MDISVPNDIRQGLFLEVARVLVTLEYLTTPMYCKYERSPGMLESRCASSHWVAVTYCAEGGRFVPL